MIGAQYAKPRLRRKTKENQTQIVVNHPLNSGNE
jgi:hypothetical protein